MTTPQARAHFAQRSVPDLLEYIARLESEITKTTSTTRQEALDQGRRELAKEVGTWLDRDIPETVINALKHLLTRFIETGDPTVFSEDSAVIFGWPALAHAEWRWQRLLEPELAQARQEAQRETARIWTTYRTDLQQCHASLLQFSHAHEGRLHGHAGLLRALIQAMDQHVHLEAP